MAAKTWARPLLAIAGAVTALWMPVLWMGAFENWMPHSRGIQRSTALLMISGPALAALLTALGWKLDSKRGDSGRTVWPVLILFACLVELVVVALLTSAH